MKLKEFVRETLVQILEGVKEAQATAKGMGAIINPRLNVIDSLECSSEILVRNVDFDVVVTEQKGIETKGGLGIFVGGLGVGTTGKSDEGKEAVNRIKFSVPISYPTQ